MRAAVSTPTTKAAPGRTRAFSRNVGARVSSTVPRQPNCSSRRRTSTAASAGLSAFTTDSSKVTRAARISLATRASSRCPAWRGLNEPASTPRGTGAFVASCPSGSIVRRSMAPASSRATRSSKGADGATVSLSFGPRRDSTPGVSIPQALASVRSVARATRSSSAARSRAPRSSTIDTMSTRPPSVTAMWQRWSPCFGRSVTRLAVTPAPTSRAPVRPERRAARATARRAMATAVAALHACSGSWPRKSTRASGLYGTMASTRVREPPGTRSSAAIAPLPPPVIARTTRRPEAWTRSTMAFSGFMSIVQYRSCAASADEGMEALAGYQAPRFDRLEPGLSELPDQLGPPREAAAALGHRRPEIEDVDADALSLAEGRQQQSAAGPEESAYVTQDPHPVLDREVVDVVVQRREVEGGLGGARHDVARLDRDAPREAPGGDVLGRQGGHLGLELQPEGRQLGVTPCGVADVDRRPAADLEESNRARARHDVFDHLAHERLDEARRAGHEPAVLIPEHEAAPRAQARRRFEDPDAVQPRRLFDERGGRVVTRVGELPRERPAQSSPSPTPTRSQASSPSRIEGSARSPSARRSSGTGPLASRAKSPLDVPAARKTRR